jgi:cytochrome c553
MKAIQTLIFALIFVLAGHGIAQDEPSLPGRGMKTVTQEEIEPLTTMCESCHGTGGNSTRQDVPAIAGKPEAFIMASLEQFYYGERHCPDVQFKNYNGDMETKSMCDITNALTKPEGLALAQFFANQKVPEKAQEQ